MNRRVARHVLALLSLAVSGCGLLSPPDGTVVNRTTDSIPFWIRWANPNRNVRLECLAKGTWVPFQTTQIGSTIVAPGSPGLYGVDLNVVIPDRCWTVSIAGAAAPLNAIIQARIEDTPGTWTQIATYTQAALQCLTNNALHADNPNSPNWVTRSQNCYTGLTATIYAKHTMPQVSTMLFDLAASDLFDPSVQSSGLARTTLAVSSDYGNLLTIDGLDLGQHPGGSYGGRAPWDTFLVDAPNPAQALSFYRDLLTRNGVINGPLDTRSCSTALADPPTPYGWLCAAEQHAATVHATRTANGVARRLHIYAFLVSGFDQFGTPVPDVDGSLPSAFGAPPSLNNAPTAPANLMQFLTVLYDADYVEPWRELIFVNTNAPIPLQNAYEYIVARVHSAAPLAVVTASVHVPFANCPFGNCANVDPKAINGLQTYWRINRTNPRGSGAVPFVIAFSNYTEFSINSPDLSYGLLTDRTQVSANNLYRLLEAAAALFTDPAERDAFRRTPIAIAEGGWGTWYPLPLWLFAPAYDVLHMRVEEKQAAYLKWLLTYRHDAQDPGIHPMLFVANWWGVDHEWSPIGSGQTGNGILASATQRYRWKSVTAVQRGALSGSQNTDTDGDGVADIVVDAVTGIVSSQDNCPTVGNPAQSDGDGDGSGDACDNCPATNNRSQRDWDQDGYGNRCDADINNDGQVDAVDLLIVGVCTPTSIQNPTLCDTFRSGSGGGDPFPLHTMDLDEDASLTTADYDIAVGLVGVPLQISPFACAGQRPCPASP